jgi:hypothetical protein
LCRSALSVVGHSKECYDGPAHQRRN